MFKTGHDQPVISYRLDINVVLRTKERFLRNDAFSATKVLERQI
jgi:hypothetical protein